MVKLEKMESNPVCLSLLYCVILEYSKSPNSFAVSMNTTVTFIQFVNFHLSYLDFSSCPAIINEVEMEAILRLISEPLKQEDCVLKFVISIYVSKNQWNPKIDSLIETVFLEHFFTRRAVKIANLLESKSAKGTPFIESVIEIIRCFKRLVPSLV